MQMEAHHQLEQFVDLRCCSRIQLEVRNADRYPGTVTVELVLLNSEFPTSGAQSLGKALVSSMPDISKDPVTPVAETLDFVSKKLGRTEFEETRPTGATLAESQKGGGLSRPERREAGLLEPHEVRSVFGRSHNRALLMSSEKEPAIVQRFVYFDEHEPLFKDLYDKKPKREGPLPHAVTHTLRASRTSGTAGAWRGRA